MREKDILKRNISLILMIFFLLSGVMFARGIAPYNNSFAKADAEGKTRSLSNMGNWLYWMYSDGQSGIDPGGSSGGVYPRGTAGV
ncbi:MAG: hypothetical protein KAR38_02025, partial [Calditrichia bacterium]|nr:hypothetical protein [Calditrichia bacterium]